MDNLEMDVIRCKIAGVSYGQYKATHPVTRVIDTDDGMEEKSCAFCGKRFKTKNKRKIYCCEVCCQNASSRKQAEKKARGEQWKK